MDARRGGTGQTNPRNDKHAKARSQMLNISEKGSQTPYTNGYRTRKETKSHGVKKSNKKQKSEDMMEKEKKGRQDYGQGSKREV